MNNNKFIDKEYQKIWDLAAPYNDKRDDEGHAKIVTEFAIKLCEIEKVDDKIVVPAAILHDVGWSQLSKQERFSIFDSKVSSEVENLLRIKHQDEGVKLAAMLLKKIKYPENLIKLILEIISQHDTRKYFLSKEDGAMRDADKLWCYSKTGFEADIKRRGYTFDFLYNKMKKMINKENYLYFKSAKSMAFKELEIRHTEFIDGKII